MNSPHHVVILGAGMCGLYAARRLAAAGVRVTVLEKMDRVGGLGSSLEQDGVNYDLGVKHLHAHDEEIFADIQSLMGADLLPVPLRAKIRFGNRFRRYPLKLADLLTGIPPWTIGWLFGGLTLQQMKNHWSQSDPENAEQALIQLYGGPLYRYFFRDFTHRYWGVTPAKLSATFVSRKMPRLGAVDLLKQCFLKLGAMAKFDSDVENALAEETLYYSQDGAIAIPRRLATAVEADGGRIVISAEVQGIHLQNQRVTKVTYCVDDEERDVECDHVISTIPVTSLVRMLRPLVSNDVRESADQLSYRPIAVYGLLVRRPQVLDALYIYYRNRMFHRIAEPSQSGLDPGKPGHAVLLVECTCALGDEVWHDEPKARERLLQDLIAENVVVAEEIVTMNHQRTAFGYPMFALGFEEHHQRLQQTIAQVSNLESIGRQGGFCYPNMHETMRQGAAAAQRVAPHA